MCRFSRVRSDCSRSVQRADRACIDASTRPYRKSFAPASIYVSLSLSCVTERASPISKIFPLRGRRTTQTRQSRPGRSEMQLLQEVVLALTERYLPSRATYTSPLRSKGTRGSLFLSCRRDYPRPCNEPRRTASPYTGRSPPRGQARPRSSWTSAGTRAPARPSPEGTTRAPRVGDRKSVV